MLLAARSIIGLGTRPLNHLTEQAILLFRAPAQGEHLAALSLRFDARQPRRILAGVSPPPPILW
jgi:hypothetical protein